MVKICVTGANGLMGKVLKDYLDFIPLTRKECDITNREEVDTVFKRINPDITLHLAGYTDVLKAEVDKENCYATNVLGTENVARASRYLIYVSTEYVFDGMRGMYTERDIPNPVNFYSLTKLLGEKSAEKAKKYCVIRTLFKPRPYKHDRVPTDMYTSGDYVDIIAREIVKAVKLDLPPLLNIGTGRKSLYDLAKKTRDVEAISRQEISVTLPRDTSLNTALWESIKNEKLGGNSQ